jgi:hypothetical protein
MNKLCVCCGGPLERGTIQGRNFPAPFEEATGYRDPVKVVSELSFVRPGVPTSPNPVKAFLQGLKEEKSDEWLPVTAYRCKQCGRLELSACQE